MRINEIVYRKKKSWQTIKSFTVSVCGAVIPVRARIVLQEWTSDWAYVENGVEETGLHGLGCRPGPQCSVPSRLSRCWPSRRMGVGGSSDA